MNLFAGVLPFVHVAEERSFRRAAERLGVTTAAVSKAVAKLEGDLGVTLLARTSRRVSLTAEGALFLERCRDAVDAVRVGRELVSQSQRTPQGKLRVSLPPILGRKVVPDLPRFLARWPRVVLEVSFTNRYVRLADEEIDVAVRIGQLEPSSLVARRLATPRWVTVASPAYLARRGTPLVPGDLAAHDCLKFVGVRGTVRELAFVVDGATVTVPTGGRLVIDQGEHLLEAALAGAGIVQVLDFMTDAALREGKLVEVLREHAAQGPPIHALTLPRRNTVPRVRAFLEHIEEILRAPGARTT